MARTVVNALGDTLYYSGSSTGFFSATGSGPRLNGTAGNDSMWGDSAVNVTMAGGLETNLLSLFRHQPRDRKCRRGRRHHRYLDELYPA